jgi:hypothetical protein
MGQAPYLIVISECFDSDILLFGKTVPPSAAHFQSSRIWRVCDKFMGKFFSLPPDIPKKFKINSRCPYLLQLKIV